MLIGLLARNPDRLNLQPALPVKFSSVLPKNFLLLLVQLQMPILFVPVVEVSG
jgi:hypothetical protein